MLTLLVLVLLGLQLLPTEAAGLEPLRPAGVAKIDIIHFPK